MLTVKSDDIQGRVSTYEAIVKGNEIQDPGLPASFRVLVKELQSLGLAVEAVLDTGETIKFGKDEEKVKAPRIESALLSANDKAIDDQLKNVDKLLDVNDMPSNPFAGLGAVDLSWNTVTPKINDENAASEDDEEDFDGSSIDIDDDSDNEKPSLDDLDSLMN